MWQKVPTFVRAELIHKFANAILEHKEELVQIECTDNGKPRQNAEKDVMFASMILKYNAGACDRLDG